MINCFAIYRCDPMASKKEESSNPPPASKGADPKTLATFILVFLALIAAGLVLLPRSPAFVPQGEPVTSGVFLERLSLVPEVSIVMDLRRATGENLRHGILQCGVDFAGSSGLVEKNVSTYAWEENGCVSSTHTGLSLADCFRQIQGETVLYIAPGEETTFYRDALVVGIGEHYALYDCRINVMP